MKLILLIILASVAAFGAETNVVKVFTTNHIVAASNLHEVDGQLYDILRSQKWESVRCKYQRPEGDFVLFRKIEHVKIGEREPESRNERMNSSGLFTSAGAVAFPTDRNIYEDQDGAFILLKNFPAGNFVTGQQLTPRLLRVGQTNYNGSVVAIYDCGKPHLIPVVTSKIIKQ